jgi:hypothetical protein
MTQQLNIDDTKFYKIIPSSDEKYQVYEQAHVSDPDIKNNLKEDFIQEKTHYYLTTHLTEKFVDESKYRSEYDILMMKNYHN